MKVKIVFSRRFFQKILPLWMVSIQERFVIKIRLWWHAYSSFFHQAGLKPTTLRHEKVGHGGKLKIWIRLDKGFGPIMSPSIFVCTMCVVEGPAGPTQLLLALLQLLPYLPTTSGSNIYTNYQNRSIDFYISILSF